MSTNKPSNFWLQNRSIVALALSLLALAEIIDLTIVAVALPNIMGSLSANLDEVSLAITSYIVAAAIFIPLSGFVTGKYGVKRVALFSTVVFGIASICCGLATNIPEMVVFRILQGIGGAFMPSLVQGYIADHFKGPDRNKMMSVFTVCIVLGPIIGPIIGGVITDSWSWRWIFYINIPICILAFFIIATMLENTHIKPIRADYISFIFMVFAFGGLEYFLDNGNSHNWFESHSLIIILTIAIISLGFFIWRALLGYSIVNLQVFKYRNFTLSCLSMFIFMVFLAGMFNFFPTLLQQGYGFNVADAGYLSAPRGLAALCAVPLIIQLGKKIDARIIMVVGLLLFIFSGYLLSHLAISHNVPFLIIIMIIQGIGMMSFFINLMQFTYVKLPEVFNHDASGVINFFRNIGVSVGTSIASTVLSHQQQISWHDLVSHITAQSLSAIHFTVHKNIMWAVLAVQVQQQAFIIANLDVFYYSYIGLFILIIIPFFLLKADPHAKIILE